MRDWSNPAPDPVQQVSGAADADAPMQPWWRRSPLLAAGAALAIGLGTLWFANMLGRVPLDSHATLGYLLMLPLLLIVPAFSAAGLRLSWLAWRSNGIALRWFIAAIVLAGATANIFALAGFASALFRIFAR